MSDLGERLSRSAQQAADIAKGTAKPGGYRVTSYDKDGKPRVTAGFSVEVQAEINAEIAAEHEAPAKQPDPEQSEPSQAGKRVGQMESATRQ